MSPDEARELENMNPLPDGQGSVYLVQKNMQALDRIGGAAGPARKRNGPARR